VSDDGPGVPPDVRERMFQPFVTARPDGTGLGLYIVARRVRELGGEIECRTGDGAGTSFRVTLPCDPPPPPTTTTNEPGGVPST
jgi:two-component system nitrogen regulation sensor histidine kinase GlnL